MGEAERKETTRRKAETEEPGREELCCAECGGQLVHDESHGETVCEACGLVVAEEELDTGPEWRAFDAQERDEKSRVGAPATQLLHDKGLSTNIGWRDEDAHGTSLTGRQRQKMQRLRTWNERFRTQDHTDRSLKHALGEVERMGAALGLPETVRETAAVIFRRAQDEDLLPGRSVESVASASLYAATRLAGAPRSLDEITSVSRVAKLELSRTYWYILRELDLEVKNADPASYLPRYTSELDVPEEIERRARELLDASKHEGVHSGKSPVGLAAAAIYAAGLVTNTKVTQRAVAAVADVTEVTIRNRYPELLEAADEMPPA